MTQGITSVDTDALAGHGTRSALVHSARTAISTERRVIKSMLDTVLAATGLLVLLPVFAIVWVAIRLSSPGPVLFRQTRVGAGQRPFVMYKFRTMAADCDQRLHREYVERLLAGEAPAVDGMYKLADDPRITRVGRMLRKWSIDELPQLINVLRGELALVGPRPALPFEVERFPTWAESRFAVKPGITGLWQVSGRSRLTMLEGLRLDVRYAAESSLWLDLRILLRTLPALLRGGAR